MKKQLILFCLIAFAMPAISQSKTEQIDRLMKHCSANNMLNGTVLVFEKGKVIYSNAFGVANKTTGEPLKVESAFYLASVSKAFTAMAIMLLQEKKKLSYEDKLSTYFPEFPAYARNVTIQHLLNHTSGIPDYFRLNVYRLGLKNSDVLAVLQKRDSLDFIPGQRFSYSNGGYVLLSMIVEKVSGMSYPEFMKQQVFQPLGMKNTLVYDQSTAPIKNRAIGYNLLGEKDDYEILTTGDGGMFSSVQDMHLWLQAQAGGKLVSEQTMKQAFTPAVLNNGKLSNYGFGWGLVEREQKKYIVHGGSLAGFRTYVSNGLSDGNGHILLTNYGDAVALNELNHSIGRILAGLPYELPKIPISLKLIQSLNTTTASEAIQHVQNLLKEKPGEYVADEEKINMLGYSYLQRKQPAIAKQIFQFNIDTHPSSANVFDSMGEVLLATGDTANAVLNYKQSLLLNPNNRNAANVLKRVGVNAVADVEERKVPVEKLKLYIGKYEIVPGFILDITLDGEQLYVQATGQPAAKLYAATDTRFFIKEANAQMTFNADAGGKVVSLTLHQGGDTVAKKIE